MNPQQPYIPPPPRGSEYEFFLNPDKPPRRTALPGFGPGKSLGVRIGVIAAAAFGVIIILYMLMSILGGKSDAPNLITVVQDQNELVRVANLATTIGASQSSQTTQNFAQSTALSLSSEENDLIVFLTAHGSKPSPKLLAQTKNLQTNTQLSNALASSSFDTTFSTIMQNQLKSYEIALQTAYNGARDTSEKQMLSNDYTSAALLVKQLNDQNQ